MSVTTAHPKTYWKELFSSITPEMRSDVHALCLRAEARRIKARKDTGTVSEAAALLLRALTTALTPKIAVEVGTFIGTSADAIQAGHLYTCDTHNDCVESTPHRTCFPFWRSTQMLMKLHQRQMLVDFFFFDGRIQEDDLPMIHDMRRSHTVFAFDDFVGGEKGVVNVRRLKPWLPMHELVEPPKHVLDLTTTTTIALLIPRLH